MRFLIKVVAVFPAHAGMSRYELRHLVLAVGFPRSRGDEPQFHQKKRLNRMFSPLTRG